MGNNIIRQENKRRGENSLAIKLGLEKKPFDKSYNNPSVENLRRIGKKNQTEDLVRRVVFNNCNYDSVFGDSHPSYTVLCYVSRRFLKPDICLHAVKKDGRNLKYVPPHMITEEMCVAAVYTYGMALKNVPPHFLNENIIEVAVTNDGMAIREVPDEKKTYALCKLAVENDASAIEFVPKRLMSNELAESAVKFSRLNEKMKWTIELLPEEFLTCKLVDLSFSLIPHSIRRINPRYISEETLAKYNQYMYSHRVANETGINQVNETVLVRNKPSIIHLEEDEDEKAVNIFKQLPVLYDLSEGSEEDSLHFYYISDIHIEKQLGLYQQPLWYIKDEIKTRVDKLLKDVPKGDNIILVGGDVADSPEMACIFFKYLRLKWGQGRIVYVLGNHELWDEVQMERGNNRSVDEVIDAYKKACSQADVLENELLVFYKSSTYSVISEWSILRTEDDELRDICSNSEFIILGGIGFTASNAKYNADYGLYKSKLTMEDDRQRTARFKAVYDKTLRCAADKRVIVLSHTGMADWSTDCYNPNWIYVSGHTHVNKLIVEEQRATVFSDNQVGYKPRKWKLKGFSIDKIIYDPFSGYNDGIYEITKEQYIEFNRGRGIIVEGCVVNNIRMLKKDGIYMFVTQGKNCLQLLNGGKVKNLEKDIGFYYDNISVYNKKVLELFTPYQKMLEEVSQEVRLLGGSGYIHGCIVDIDVFNHIYVNPFDGKITPYYAENTELKIVYEDVEMLLLESPSMYNRTLLQNYRRGIQEDKLALLSSKSRNGNQIACVPKVVLDKTMYKPSRIMKSIQYVIGQNVIRIWNDDVLKITGNDVIDNLYTGATLLLTNK